MRKVYAYGNVDELRYAPYFDEIRKIPIIVASQSYCNLLESKLSLQFKPCSFSHFFSMFSGGWKNKFDRIGRSSIVSEYFHKRMENTSNVNEKTWLIKCNRNKKLLVNNIALLIEADVEPENVVSDDDDLMLMVDIWKYTIKNCISVQKLKSGLQSLSNHEVANSLIIKTFGNTSKTIVMCGFYFITPLQERVFMALESAGYTLIMLVGYDSRYPFVNEIWKSTYSEDCGYPPISDWTIHNGTRNNIFGNLFNTESDIQHDGDIEIHEQCSLMDLIQDVKTSYDYGYLIYSPDSKKANNIIRDFFSHDECTFSSRPLGHFIQILYRMWDEHTNTIGANIDTIKDCFSTGCISLEKYNSQDYTSLVNKIGFFFQDCMTFDEWTERLDVLENIITEVVPCFNKNKTENRWENLMANPLLNISPFSINLNECEIIKLMITRVFDMAYALLSSESSTTIEEHFNLLYTIIHECVKVNPLLENEWNVLKSILNEDLPVESHRYRPCDLRDAMIECLDDKTENEDDQYTNYFVKPLRDIDESLLNESNGVHIILSDRESLPGKNRKFSWPLSRDLILEMNCSHPNVLLRNLVHIMDSTTLSNRYLAYEAFYNKRVILSWVAIQDSKIMPPSPYVHMLTDVAGVKVMHINQNNISLNDNYSIQKVDSKNFDICKIIASSEAKMDYALCPLKYIYGYVLQNHPSFSSSYHMQFLMSNLIGSIMSLCPEMCKNEVIENVEVLFPNLMRIEKLQAADYAYVNHNLEFTDYNGHKYTDERYRMLFLTSDLRNMASIGFGKLYSTRNKNVLKLNHSSKFKGACVFCQHNTYCRYVIFGLDQEDYYGN